jgi:hypothetical protein
MKRSWSSREWLPNAGTLTLIGVTTTAETVVVEADGPSARCRPIVPFPSQSLLAHVEGFDGARPSRHVARAPQRWRCERQRCDTAFLPIAWPGSPRRVRNTPSALGQSGVPESHRRN